jgi:hypothetical protein
MTEHQLGFLAYCNATRGLVRIAKNYQREVVGVPYLELQPGFESRTYCAFAIAERQWESNGNTVDYSDIEVTSLRPNVMQRYAWYLDRISVNDN